METNNPYAAPQTKSSPSTPPSLAIAVLRIVVILITLLLFSLYAGGLIHSAESFNEKIGYIIGWLAVGVTAFGTCLYVLIQFILNSKQADKP